MSLNLHAEKNGYPNRDPRPLLGRDGLDYEMAQPKKTPFIKPQGKLKK